MGWKEGESLGKDGTGVKEPVRSLRIIEKITVKLFGQINLLDFYRAVLIHYS